MKHTYFSLLHRKWGLGILCLLLAGGLSAAGTPETPFYLSELFATADEVPETGATSFEIPFRIDANTSAASVAFTCNTLVCQSDYEVDCLADAAVPNPPDPNDLPNAGDDNCEVTELTWTDTVDNNPADPQYSAIITRVWSAKVNGIPASCTQTISVKKGQEPVVTPPADVNDLSCEASTDPSNTGMATATDSDGPVPVTFHDAIENQVGEDCYTIVRTWMASNDCGDGQAVQYIHVVDNEDPEFVDCPGDLTVASMDEVPDVGDNPGATDNCDDDVAVVYNGEQSSTTDGVTTITRSWTATDNCGNTTDCEQKITVTPPPPPLENECYSLAPCMEYDSEAGTTRFTWELCLIGDDCKAISNIRFSIPCELPKSALLESSSSMDGLIVEINGRTGHCERYDVQFEGFGDDAMKHEPNQCVTFSYLIDADLREYVTDVAIKAGNQEGLDFPGISISGCTAEQVESSASTSTTSSEEFAGQPGNENGRKSLVQTSTDATGIAEVVLFPNPARDLITLRFASDADQRVDLRVYDATGRVAFARALEASAGTNNLEISLGDVPAGLYQMVVTPVRGERAVKSFLRLQ